jgi:myo-inositol 2-dehydrogenase/D-chiro-inositol 1-dehydrogenase
VAVTTALRVGIIGTGRAGAGHAAAYGRLPGVAVAAVWSRTRGRAEALAAAVGGAAPPGAPPVAVYDRWEELLDGGVDAVSLTAATPLRRAPVEYALRRGLAILVEKPLSVDLPEARAIAAAAAGGAAVTAVAFNWRYSPRVQAAWRAAQAGAIGRIREVRSLSSLLASPALFGVMRQKLWAAHRANGGGFLREVGTHQFDRVRFLTGQEFRRVAGRLTPWGGAPWPVPAPPGADADLEYALLAELADGSLVSLQTAFTAGAAGEQTVLSGAAGTLTISPQGVLVQRPGAAAEPVEIQPADRAPDDLPAMQHTWNRLIADFVAAVRAGDVRHATVPHLPTIADGLRAQEVVAAAERADAERRWVDLTELG